MRAFRYRPLRTPVGLVLGTGLLAVACDSATPITRTEAPPVVVRDSAGIEIVQVPSTAVANAPRLRLSTTPSLSIGILDGEDPYLFSQIRGAGRFAGGEFVVADGATQELRLFDSQGAFVRRLAREGEGPGELRSIFDLRVGDSTVLLIDFTARAVQRFHRSGAHDRTAQLPPLRPPVPGAARFLPTNLSISPSGALLYAPPSQTGSGGARGGTQRDEGLFELPTTVSRVEAEELELVLSLPPNEVFVASRGEGDWAYWVGGYRPLGRRAFWTVDDHGFVVARSHTLGFDHHDPDGRPVRFVRVDSVPPPVTEEGGRRMLDSIARAAAARPDDQTRQRWAEIVEIGTELPLSRAVNTGRDGTVWVLSTELVDVDPVPAFEELAQGPEADRTEGSTRLWVWVVFSAEGEVLASVELPMRAKVFEYSLADGLVLGRRDEFDVEYVVLHTLEAVDGGDSGQ